MSSSDSGEVDKGPHSRSIPLTLCGVDSTPLYLCDEVRVADDGSDEEAVIGDLGTFLHTGGAQVQVHFVVGTGHGCQVKVTHAVQLQLEGQSRLQVPVDTVLLELGERGRVGVEREIVYKCFKVVHV